MELTWSLNRTLPLTSSSSSCPKIAIFGQDEELEVKGNVLFKDQVNSMKPPAPILNVPQSVSIITDEDILNQGFRALGDIVRYVPGIHSTQGEGHRDAMVIRGIRTTSDFYLDGHLGKNQM